MLEKLEVRELTPGGPTRVCNHCTRNAIYHIENKVLCPTCANNVIREHNARVAAEQAANTEVATVTDKPAQDSSSEKTGSPFKRVG